MENIEHIRHSLAHLLAAAVLKKFPEAKLGIGPVIENGFYYDFQLPRALTPDDLKEFEVSMKKFVSGNLPFTGKTVSVEEAKEIFKEQPFKLDLIEEFSHSKEPLSIYSTGEIFFDLCRGGHVENTKMISTDAFQLSHIAGAYWRGNEKNPMLTRIYGLAFANKKELDAHLAMVEEAKKRDHKLIGKQQKLFTFSPLVGPGLPLFMPNGMKLRTAILDYITHIKEANGYKFVWTPHLAKEALYKQSGHLGKYDAMLPTMETEEGEHLIVKPMNCPHHFQIYNAEPHSYRDLPYRIAENATDYRNEKSGELNGLLRVRSLTQDDTHHVVRHDQIASEIDLILGLIAEVYHVFGFTNFRARISTRSIANKEKYFGVDSLWETAEKALIAAVERWGVPYFIGEGEAAFYGPKIDVLVKDALGREWQLSTVQLDYVQPENFDMTYTNAEGHPERPAILHVAILGSLDRFMGIIIEHFGGNFPVWLSPVQTIVLPIAAAHADYAQKVVTALRMHGIRTESIEATETLGKRVREAELQRVPYILVVGEREAADNTVTVRERHKKETTAISLEDFIARIRKEVEEKK